MILILTMHEAILEKNKGKMRFLGYRFSLGLCWFLARKYLLNVGHVPFAPKGAHDPHEGVARSYDEAWGRGTTRPSETYNNLGRETVVR